MKRNFEISAPIDSSDEAIEIYELPSQEEPKVIKMKKK